MTKQTFQLPAANYQSLGAFSRLWRFNSGRPRVIDAFSPVLGDAVQARYLVNVEVSSLRGAGVAQSDTISVNFDDAASGADSVAPLGAGFTAADPAGTFRITLSTGESILLPVPSPPNDPYFWRNADFSETDFLKIWNALGASGESATLELEVVRGVRIGGRQEIEGVGSSAVEVTYPVRIAGRQEIEGTGSSAVEITTDVRIGGRQEIEGTGASEVQVINPTRIAGRQEIEGTGGSGVEVTQPTRIAGRQEIEGTGSSALRVVAPVRIAGRQEIAGTGSSLLEIVQPLGWDTEIRASAPREAIITALEIEHPDASAPLRVVDAAADRTIGGETYRALRFDAKLAFDDESRAPHAEISIDNVGRVGTEWLEETRGGAGATVRIMQALDVAPWVVEWEMTLDLLRTAVDSDRIAARLGFDPGLGRGAVAMRHDPATTPGIF